MAKADEGSIELPVTTKLTSAARSLNLTPPEFRELWDRYGYPVLRPSKRRELVLEGHLHELCLKIAGPAQRGKAATQPAGAS